MKDRLRERKKDKRKKERVLRLDSDKDVHYTKHYIYKYSYILTNKYGTWLRMTTYK